MILNISSQGIFFEKHDCRSKRKLYAYGRGVGHGEEILDQSHKDNGSPRFNTLVFLEFIIYYFNNILFYFICIFDDSEAIRCLGS